MQKNEIDPLFFTTHKSELEMYLNFIVILETIKLLEEIGKKFLGIGLGNDFLDMTPKAIYIFNYKGLEKIQS